MPPAHPSQVIRPRLLRSLSNSLSLPLSIITAPPGFGKTTLLAAWVESFMPKSGKSAVGEMDNALDMDPSPAIGWVSLDADDNFLPRFWMYLIAALYKAIGHALHESQVPSALTEIQGLLAATTPPYQVFLTLLINAISDLPLKVILILDDYHFIHDPEITESVVYLIDHCPANLHLVIASRTDPPLPLGRWRGRRQLNILRAQELRFSLAESLEYLNGSMGLSLTPENVAYLDQRTEGWVVGLQMAAFALQDMDAVGVNRVIHSFSGRHHFLLDYFTEEILQRQSEEIQNFLLLTSVLGRMCAELCAAVISDGKNTELSSVTPTKAQTVLEHLEHANLFVVPLDTERLWYRYHHLFNDLLLTRLRHKFGHAEEVSLRQLAARWHASQGHLSEAIYQAMQAGDYSLAADLIESPAQSLRIFEAGDVAAILKWTQELPPEVIHKHLWLKLYQSRSLFYAGKFDAAETILEEIDQAIQIRPDQVPQGEKFLGMVLSHKARYASVRDKFCKAREIAYQALQILPESEISARSFVFPTLALSAYRMGDVEEAARLFEETAGITRRIGSRFQTTGNLTNLAITRLAQGKLYETIRLTREGIQEGTVQSILLPETGWLHFPLAEALYEQNKLEEAELTITEGLTLIGIGKLTDYFGLMPALLARIQFALGRVEEAQTMMETALASSRRTTVTYYVSEIEAHQAQLWLEMGAQSRAYQWAKVYQSQPKTECLYEIEDITLGEVLMASGQLKEASSLLIAKIEGAHARGRYGRSIRIHALLALARQAMGDEPGARAELEQALSLGEPEAYARPFLHLGKPMAALLRQLAEKKQSLSRSGSSVSVEYINKLLDMFPGEIRHTHAQKKPQSIDSLTPRELEVLRLLGEGLSNREIAERLYLSPNTLRVYTTNLYAKLDVHTRTQAVTRARDLGII